MLNFDILLKSQILDCERHLWGQSDEMVSIVPRTHDNRPPQESSGDLDCTFFLEISVDANTTSLVLAVFSRLSAVLFKHSYFRLSCPSCPDLAAIFWLGLTRETLFEILARIKTRFLGPKFSRDSRDTHDLKLVARLASRESRRQKFRSETRFSRVPKTYFVARLASRKSPGQIL